MKPIVAFDAGIAVGVAGMVGRMALAGAETDPVKISPQYYRVRIDNEWLRVLEYRLKPGPESGSDFGHHRRTIECRRPRKSTDHRTSAFRVDDRSRGRNRGRK